MVAEDPHGQGLDPEGTGEFVQGDRPGGVEGAEEEIVPVGRHAANRRRVERFEGILADAPGVREPGQTGDQKEERSRKSASKPSSADRALSGVDSIRPG